MALQAVEEIGCVNRVPKIERFMSKLVRTGDGKILLIKITERMNGRQRGERERQDRRTTEYI